MTMCRIYYLLIDKSSVCVSFRVVTVDGSLKSVDHVIIRVVFIIVKHTVVGALL